MMDKPAGVLSVTEDSRQRTVFDVLPPQLRRMGLAPVGRLDKDTSGLLLLTNDGELAHKIISPKSAIPKRYLAEVEGEPDAEDVRAFREGLTLADGTRCLPAELEPLGEGRCLVTVMEGTPQVKRMLARARQAGRGAARADFPWAAWNLLRKAWAGRLPGAGRGGFVQGVAYREHRQIVEKMGVLAGPF